MTCAATPRAPPTMSHSHPLTSSTPASHPPPPPPPPPQLDPLNPNPATYFPFTSAWINQHANDAKSPALQMPAIIKEWGAAVSGGRGRDACRGGASAGTALLASRWGSREPPNACAPPSPTAPLNNCSLPCLPQPTDQRVPIYDAVTTDSLTAITADKDTVGGLKGECHGCAGGELRDKWLWCLPALRCCQRPATATGGLTVRLPWLRSLPLPAGALYFQGWTEVSFGGAWHRGPALLYRQGVPPALPMR